jgi:putative endonuclease
MAWFVYVVRCGDGSLYTGIATDVEARVSVHNDGRGARYTRSRRPVTLVYVERRRNRSAALKRELKIKALTRAEKLALLEKRPA